MQNSFFTKVHETYKDANLPSYLAPYVYFLALRNTLSASLKERTRQRAVNPLEKKPLQERAAASWDIDLPFSGVDPNYHQDGRNTHEKFIL